MAAPGLASQAFYSSAAFSSQGSPLYPSDRGGRMTLEEIKREFAKYKLECPDTMWREPQTEQVQGLYSFAIECIFGLTVNEVRIEEVTGDVRSCLPSIDSLQFLSQDGRHHAKAIGNLRFFRLCQRLNKVLGLPDFSREMFAAPSAAAVLRFASSVCSFLRLRENLLKQFEVQLQQREALQQNLEKISEDAQRVEQELLRFRAERQTQLPVSQQQKQRREELEAELRKRHGELGALMEEFAERQAVRGRLELELGDLVLELTNLKQEREELHDQVVHAPEKLMERRDELRMQQKLLDQQLQQLERAAASQQKLLLAFGKALKKAKKALEILSEHRDKVLAPHLAFRSDMRTREKFFREISEQKKKLTQTVHELQTERARLNRELETLEKKTEEEEAELRQRLLRTKQETEERKKMMINQQEMTAALLREAEDLEDRLAQQKAGHRALLHAIEEEIQRVHAAFLTYVSQLHFLRNQMPLSLDLSQSASFLADHHAKRFSGFSPSVDGGREDLCARDADYLSASLLESSAPFADDASEAGDGKENRPLGGTHADAHTRGVGGEAEGADSFAEAKELRGGPGAHSAASPAKAKRISSLDELEEAELRMEDLREGGGEDEG
ncbi:Nuf2 [Besnoitia besnoiti]|uniref:Nuf2 n=1 Tax=Besnoitia besnoiti TaxID=94643 RepID=A0A2A9M7I8_BESBE|nr:Nuf2 [Besnoitia besnoiti]PFH33899.1 Nuf2 [Besnoitia besnoiti]